MTHSKKILFVLLLSALSAFVTRCDGSLLLQENNKDQLENNKDKYDTQVFHLKVSNITEVKEIFKDEEPGWLADGDRNPFPASPNPNSLTHHYFLIQNMMRFELDADGNFTYINYAPIPFTDFTVYATVGSSDKEIPVIQFEGTVAPFHQYKGTIFTGKLPITAGSKDITYTFNGSGRNMKKIKEIKLDWLITYRRPDDIYWNPIFPEDARILSLSLMNIAYLFSSDDFYTMLENDIVLCDNSQVRNVTAAFYYNQQLLKRKLGFAIAMAYGVGGYAVTPRSQDDYRLTQNGDERVFTTVGWISDSISQFGMGHNYAYPSTAAVIIHEINHTFEYGHSGCLSGSPLDPGGDVGKNYDLKQKNDLQNRTGWLYTEKSAQAGYFPYDFHDTNRLRMVQSPSISDDNVQRRVENQQAWAEWDRDPKKNADGTYVLNADGDAVEFTAYRNAGWPNIYFWRPEWDTQMDRIVKKGVGDLHDTHWKIPNFPAWYKAKTGKDVVMPP